MIQKTWDEFWEEFFLTRFYEANPERQHMAEEKAFWIWRHSALSEGSRVLNLGCGNGMYDLCLARMGANVTAVDRIRSVLDAARKQAGELPIVFV